MRFRRHWAWVLTGVAVVGSAAAATSGAAAATGGPAVAERGAQCHGQPAPWMDANSSPARRTEELLPQMTLDEKISMMHTVSNDQQSREILPIDRLCIPAVLMTNGSAGVSTGGPVQHPATALPAPISLASTWSKAEARQYGHVAGTEAVDQGRNLLEGPDVNIARVPVNGRTFEAYGEDPYLAGQTAVGTVRGIQAAGAMADTKHYVANNQETDRTTIDEHIDDRTLHEIYLPAFEAAVKDGHTASVMCAKNQVNSVYSCDSSHLITDILRDDWNFPGFVISDFTSIHDTVQAANGGADVELPSAKYYGDALKQAVQDGQVSEATIDRHVARILYEMFGFGLFERGDTTQPIDETADGVAARQLSERGTVLLKNDRNALPVDPAKVKSLAVVGPDAGTAITGGVGSPDVAALHTVSPVDGITRRAQQSGVQVNSVAGWPPVNLGPPAVPSYVFTTPDGQTGLRAQYFQNTSFSGSPVLTRTEPYVDFDYSGGPPAPGVSQVDYSIRWTGSFTAPTTGDYTFDLTNHGHAKVYIDGQQLIDNGGGFPAKTKSGSISLTAGQSYDIRVDFSESVGQALVELSWQPPAGTPDEMIAKAVAAAKSSDAAVVFVGDREAEGVDRPNLSLIGDQDALVRAVSAVNPNTIVVVNSGGPVLMPWVGDVPAIVEAWYPGEEDGNAIAAVLFGDVNPSAKLPITFPETDAQTPANTPAQYPGVDGVATYSEGLQVGYRWYDANDQTPLFAFGHGLSYTTFRYSDLVVSPRLNDGGQVTVSAEVTNTGSRAGADVAQVYVTDPPSAGEPPLQLKGFQRVQLAPGQTKHVLFHLGQRAFSIWDTDAHAWKTVSGTYRVHVGDASDNLPLSAGVVRGSGR